MFPAVEGWESGSLGEVVPSFFATVNNTNMGSSISAFCCPSVTCALSRYKESLGPGCAPLRCVRYYCRIALQDGSSTVITTSSDEAPIPHIILNIYIWKFYFSMYTMVFCCDLNLYSLDYLERLNMYIAERDLNNPHMLVTETSSSVVFFCSYTLLCLFIISPLPMVSFIIQIFF